MLAETQQSSADYQELRRNAPSPNLLHIWHLLKFSKVGEINSGVCHRRYFQRVCFGSPLPLVTPKIHKGLAWRCGGIVTSIMKDSKHKFSEKGHLPFSSSHQPLRQRWTPRLCRIRLSAEALDSLALRRDGSCPPSGAETRAASVGVTDRGSLVQALPGSAFPPLRRALPSQMGDSAWKGSSPRHHHSPKP